MRRYCSRERDTRGAALILCMVMTAAAVTSITVISHRTVAHVRHSQYSEWRTAATAGAELILSMTKDSIERGGEGTQGFQGEAVSIVSGLENLPNMAEEFIEPQFLEGAPELSWYSIAGSPEGRDSDIRVILAVVEVHGVHAAIEGVYRHAGGTGNLERITRRERNVRTVGYQK